MPYTLKEDHVEPFTDGSGRYKVIAKKGDVIAWDTAYITQANAQIAAYQGGIAELKRLIEHDQGTDRGTQ